MGLNAYDQADHIDSLPPWQEGTRQGPIRMLKESYYTRPSLGFVLVSLSGSTYRLVERVCLGTLDSLPA